MKRIVLIGAIGLLLAGFRTADPAEEKGRLAAERDVRAGRLVLRTYGFAAGGQTEYSRLLQERLGVRTLAVAGCVVNREILAETAAYNDVMTREIRKRFGPRVLDELQEEASRAAERRARSRS